MCSAVASKSLRQDIIITIAIKRNREVLFEVIPYLDARNQAEFNLQKARRHGSEDLAKWDNLFKQTFL